MGIDRFRFDAKRVLVVGGATGMGAAAAALAQELGADVVVMDQAPVTLAGATAIKIDLRDRASIDAAIDASDSPYDVVLSCAGAADGTSGIEKINFIGHRHLLERLVADGRLRRGSAIGMLSSTAGLGWEAELPQLCEYLDTSDFDAAAAWIDTHPGTATYRWSKQAMNAYVARQAFPLLKRGVRINAILPGPTPQAIPEYIFGSIPPFFNTLGCIIPAPASSSQPIPPQTLQPFPLQKILDRFCV